MAEMEGELRDALKDIRDTVKETQASLHAKLDTANGQFNAHLVDDARNFQRIEMTTAALHARLDDASKERRHVQSSRWALWVALSAAVLGPIAILLIELLRRKP